MQGRHGGERARRALVAACLALTPGTSASATPPAGPDASLCVQPKTPPSDTYDLVIKFEGVIAFVPRGPGTNNRKGSPNGTFKDVVALIPRTDNAETFDQYPPDFYVPHERYALHHPVVRLRASQFAGELPDVCRAPGGEACDDRYVYISLAAEDPLRPRWTHHNDEPEFAQYDVSVETCAAPAKVHVVGFENVPRLLARTGEGDTLAEAKPCEMCLAPAAPDPRLAARMTLAHGERIEARELITEPTEGGKNQPVSFAIHARSGCVPVKDARQPLVACSDDPKQVEASGSPGPFHVAQYVVAVRQQVPANVPVTLTLRRMTDGEVVHNYLLRPPTGGPLEIDVLNLPAEGLFHLPTPATRGAIAHFNLFYLLTDVRRGPFYFPAPPSLNRQDGRPWCSHALLAVQP